MNLRRQWIKSNEVCSPILRMWEISGSDIARNRKLVQFVRDNLPSAQAQFGLVLILEGGRQPSSSSCDKLEAAQYLVLEVPHKLKHASDERIRRHLRHELDAGFRATAERMAGLGTSDEDADDVDMTPEQEQDFLDAINDNDQNQLNYSLN